MGIPVVGHVGSAGFPLLFAEIDRRLFAAGIPEADGDADPTATAVLSAPSDWVFSEDTCWYATPLIDGLPDDGPLPGKGRHQWLLSQNVRLACAHRFGCLSEDDLEQARKLLDERFVWLVRNTSPRREPKRYECGGAKDFGVKRAATKTDDEARGELGGHGHNDWMTMVNPQQAPPQQAAPQQAGSKAQKPSVASQLVAMALKGYTLGVGDDGTPYGTKAQRPHIALPLRGGKLGLRTELARRYFKAHNGVVPSSQALTNAITVLEGYAAQATPRPLHLRVAGHDGKIYIDTADAQDRVIEISGGAWKFVNGAVPVIFRRTEPTGPMPDPVRSGDPSKLWKYIRITEKDRPILLAVLVSALIQPDVPHVILAFLAEHGCAKSSSARYVVSLIDPSVAPLRMPPRDIDAWVPTANGSYVVALDNLSSIADWLSDALCRAATGDGHTKRSLYTDTDLTVLQFRRVIILNSIDLGGLNGDLTDRLAPVDLVRIDDTKDGDRKAEDALATAWEQDRPAILGGLLDLAAQVHAKLPGYTMKRLPRMADFARVLGCVDDICNTKGLDQYGERAKHLAADGLAADQFIERMIELNYSCTDATAAEILAAVTPYFIPRDWPRKARTITTRLNRHAPALRSLGWYIENDNAQNKANATRWTIAPPKVCP